MKRAPLSFLVLVLMILLGPAVSATAQVRIGSHAGVNFEGTDFMIGLNAHVGFNAGDRQLMAAPSVDFFLFEDNVSIYNLNFDVALPFAAGSFSPFVAAGVLISVIRFDSDIPALGGSSDSDVGLNVRAGSFFGDPEASIRPFADLGLTISDGTSVTARGGASFRISR